jgi:hypothetical protein
MFEYKVWAYAVLVKAKAYILDEAQRTSEGQRLVPEDYLLVVSEKLVSE